MLNWTSATGNKVFCNYLDEWSILKRILLRMLKREVGNTWMLCFLLVGSPSHRHPAALAWVWSPFLMLVNKNLKNSTYMFHGR